MDQCSLSELDKTRARLITSIVVDALAPTNALLTNPAALKQLVDSGGESLWRGFKNYVADLVQNGGLPSQVQKSGFKIGENLARTPGAVVFRNPVVELIQYASMTSSVRKRPLVITPPQINKYYAMDLSPDKSLVQFLLNSGIQTFCISWRNPTAEQRNWGLDTYVAALDEAVDVVRDIASVDNVSMMGSCSGGITAAAYLGTLVGRNQQKIKNIVLAVCVLDTATTGDSAFGSLVTPETMRAAKEASRLRGVLDGHDLARMFAWMRPNDLIWNYWVNNYLLGKEPPAFDILYWNADTTRLPARLHSDYIDLYFTNPFVNPKKLSISGTAIDMAQVEVDSYVSPALPITLRPGSQCIRRRRSWVTIRHSFCRTADIFKVFSIRQPIRKPPSLPDHSRSRAQTHSWLAARSTKVAGGCTGASGCMRIRTRKSQLPPRWAMRVTVRPSQLLGHMYSSNSARGLRLALVPRSPRA